MSSQPSFQIHYFSTASTFTGKQTERLPAPLPLHRLFDELESRYPGIKSKVLSSCGVSLGEEYVEVEGEDAETVIQAGDEVAIIPPQDYYAATRNTTNAKYTKQTTQEKEGTTVPTISILPYHPSYSA